MLEGDDVFVFELRPLFRKTALGALPDNPRARKCAGESENDKGD
jgi:hypothetical protein